MESSANVAKRTDEFEVDVSFNADAGKLVGAGVGADGGEKCSAG